jgi:hypothetical protein
MALKPDDDFPGAGADAVEYTVGEGVVSLQVVVGNAQYGTIDARYSGDPKPVARAENLLSVSLGAGTALVGKTLVLRSIVSDVNPFTNKMVITYQLSGGHENRVVTRTGVVEEQGDFLYFRARFAFTAGGGQ